MSVKLDANTGDIGRERDDLLGCGDVGRGPSVGTSLGKPNAGKNVGGSVFIEEEIGKALILEGANVELVVEEGEHLDLKHVHFLCGDSSDLGVEAVVVVQVIQVLG